MTVLMEQSSAGLEVRQADLVDLGFNCCRRVGNQKYCEGDL